MNTTDTTEDLALPEGKGKKPAQTILSYLKRRKRTNTGGCRAFYTTTEWAARLECYGLNAELIVVHDGGGLAPFFNWDYAQPQDVEGMRKALAKKGYYAEQCTSWYTAIYRLEDANILR